MSELRYLQVDVFAERAGGGNPLGVVFGADAWSSDDMQRFATWTNLVETTFVLAPSRPAASYRLRIFTPAREIPFAGHPTVGSAHAALESGHVAARDGTLLQECGAGLLPIRVEGGGADRRIYVQAPAARILREGSDDALRAVLGTLPLGALAPAFVEGGRRWWLSPNSHTKAICAHGSPITRQSRRLRPQATASGLCVFARSCEGRPMRTRAKTREICPHAQRAKTEGKCPHAQRAKTMMEFPLTPHATTRLRDTSSSCARFRPASASSKIPHRARRTV